MALKIALVADIHHGADSGTKLGSAALDLMQTFASWVDTIQPDLVVDLGDRINNRGKDNDLKGTRDVARAFAVIQRPRVHLVGNHDAHHLPREALEDAMQTAFASHSLDLLGRHLVFWNSSVDLETGSFHLAPDDLAWLEADLANSALPTIIFSHLPLDSGSMIGNFYFEQEDCAHYVESAAAREIISRNGNVIACLAGHTHWNARNTIDGVHYITIHSLTESFTTHPYPTGAFGLLTIDDSLTVEVLGRDPALQRLPLKPPGHHWLQSIRWQTATS